MTLDLPALVASDRAQRVRDAVLAGGLADGEAPTPPDWAMLVRDPSNIRWLTGFTGSNAWVVLRSGRLVVVTDGRYGEQARVECDAARVDADVVVAHSAPELTKRVIDVVEGAGVVGAEAHHLTHEQWLGLAAELPLVASRHMIEQLRRVKDAAEITRIAAAARIASQALGDVAPMLADEPTELDVRDELEHRMHRLGAEGPSYDTIVASGPEHAARPHHQPVARTILPGDTVIIDVGALVDGYHSDMTRSFVIGEPSSEQLDRYEVVLTSQRAGVSAVVDGCRAVDLDAVCRQSIGEAGLGEWFVHGTGHGVGLDIHENPYVGRTSAGDVALVAGDVVTVEPGVYHSGFGGIRIEDLVVVTEDGCRNLTDFPKDTPCLPSRPTI